jgi:hypothetical protein
LAAQNLLFELDPSANFRHSRLFTFKNHRISTFPSAGQTTIEIHYNTTMQSTTFFTKALATIVSLAAVSSAANGAYILTDDLSYKNFFSSFHAFSGPDPTQGFVQYQGLASAADQHLIGYLQDTQSVYMGVDYAGKDPKGRASIRLESNKTWNQGVLIADIAHMPASTCGSWPAFWLLGKQAWPVGGEIDLLEGVNNYESNSVTLHTSKGCRVDNATSLNPNLGSTNVASTSFSGMLATDDCDVAAVDQDKNVGCSIHAPTSVSSALMGSADMKVLPSYGTDFNAANGGIYAMEWTSTYISVYFFPHASPLYKSVAHSTSPDPSQWGIPMAHFSGAGCDFKQRFKDMRIIFNTAFCGDWAGGEWSKSCAKKTGVSTCEAHVQNNPGAFAESFWEVRGLKWFQKAGVKPRGRSGRHR